MSTRPRPDADAAARAERIAAALEGARAGDPSALDVAVRELNPLLWRVARAQGVSAEDAADAVQTAWLELVRAISDIRSTRALTAWLITTTKREAWRLGRSGRRAVPVDDFPELADDAGEPDSELLRGDRDRSLWQNFRLLPERCRELLRIVAAVDRPDYDQVSEALGMPRGSIGPTRGRCLAKLRVLLDADPLWAT
jgi:RNA polymerase sigma factor (sigma-70 family)